MKNSLFIFFGLLILATACSEQKKQSTAEKPAESSTMPFEIRRTLEHDPNAFTQGLVFYDGKVIESTGGDSSWIAEYDIATGKYAKRVELKPQYFGEGITILNNKIYQLTWKNKVGFVYDALTYKKLGEFAYNYEGWGITHDQKNLIISDGTDKLHYLDTTTLKEVRTLSVKDQGQKTSKLNELEMIDGYIYANEWETDYILKIDTVRGEVVETYDLGFLTKEIKSRNPEADVLNGIAYNPQTKEVLVTGKRWPLSYIIRFTR